MNDGHEALNAALWNGVGTSEDALVPARAAEVKALAKAYIKAHLGEPWAVAFCGRDAKGKPKRAPDEKLVVAWLKALPAHLEAEVAAGRALAFRVEKKGTKGYLPTQRGRADAELAAIAQQVDAIDARLQALRAVVGGARGAPPADGAATRMREAYRALDVDGRGYVPIHRLRAAAGVSRAEFDATLRRLRRELSVDLQVGSPGDYERRELDDALLESDGTLYLTLTWRA